MLEDNQQWLEAREVTLAIWRQNPTDITATIRLGFLCWFLLMEWECLDTSRLTDKDYADFQTLLVEVTNLGLNNFKNEPEFLWIFGYMIKLSPFYFGEFEEWEKIGLNMLEKAHFLRPDDPIIEMIFLNGKPKDKYRDACRRAEPLVKARFSGSGAIYRYFSVVLVRNGGEL